MRKQRDDGKLQEAIQLTLNRVQRYEQVGKRISSIQHPLTTLYRK
jgi:hypothetical protein